MASTKSQYVADAIQIGLGLSESEKSRLLEPAGPGDLGDYAPKQEDARKPQDLMNTVPLSPLVNALTERIEAQELFGANLMEIPGIEEVAVSLPAGTIDTFLKEFRDSDDPEVCKKMALGVISCLGIRGLASLFGMRATRKSLPALPPSRSTLIRAFNECHLCANKDRIKQSRFMPTEAELAEAKASEDPLFAACPHRCAGKMSMSVGTRALTKHAERCSAGFWGGPVHGNDTKKNKRALDLILVFLNNAAWKNAHLLPHDVAVFEIRVPSGYGARWSVDGTVFRGFLEPHMEEGWAVGWKH